LVPLSVTEHIIWPCRYPNLSYTAVSELLRVTCTDFDTEGAKNILQCKPHLSLKYNKATVANQCCHFRWKHK